MKSNQFLLSLLLMFICCGAKPVSAQTLMWAKNMGGTRADYGRSTSFDGSGNVYTVGEFRDTADFDPDPAGKQTRIASGLTNTDIFISKLDANGNYLWAKSIGGTNPDVANTVMAAPNGDVYVAGAFNNTGTAGTQIDFNPDPVATSMITTQGANDIFVCKFKANGDFVWAVGIGGAGADVAQSLVIDNLENVYVTGSFTGVVNFNPGGTAQNLGTASVASGFVLKLNSAGVFQWASDIGAGGRGIRLDNAGNVLVTGSFSGTVDFNPGPSSDTLISKGSTDIFVLKLTPAGAYQWVAKMGGTGADAGTALGIDRNNNIFTTGTFSGTADFNPGPLTENLTVAGGTDIFISKLNASGNFVWAKKVGGSAGENVAGLTVDSDDKIYIGGKFDGTVDFNPGAGINEITSQKCCGGSWSIPDAFILKLNNDGEYEWAFSVGGADGDDNLYSINIDLENNFYITGDFIDTGNFAPPPGWKTIKSNGSNDVFVAKYAQPSCKTYTTLNLATGCPTLTVNGQTYTTNGTYEQRLRNAANCDSVITLNVALNNSLPTTINQTACNSYAFNGKTYTSSGTYRDTFKNISNCDSVVVLNLTINRSATTQLTQVACNSYTYNGTTYTTGGTYTHHFQTVHNCDSTVTLNLTIHNNSAPTQNTVTACNSYSFGGTTYTTGGTYTHTFRNIHNCDSVATINLTINQSSTAQISHTACETYTYDGVTYTASGSYVHYFSNSKNCDSVVTLNLTIRRGSASQVSATACGNYTLNGQTYTASGTYTQTLTAANGCDSIITLSLAINQIPEATITPAGNLLTGSSGSSWQWLNCNNNYAPIPTATNQTLVTDGPGRYAVEVTANGCKDTSDCFEIYPSGIAQHTGDALTIYPNPAREQVVIASTAAFSNASVRLISATGQRILLKANHSGNTVVLNLRGLAGGIYLVEITEGEKIYRKTLLKE